MKISKVILTIAVLAFFTPQAVSAASFRVIDNLESVTFWEVSGSRTTAFTFDIEGTQLMNRLDNLNIVNFDFAGVYTLSVYELYDVFYSDADGTFNVNGEYLSIEAIWNRTAPAGGGLNLAEMGINFADGSTEYGEYVASYVALGDNAVLSSIPYAVDGDLATATTMGNSVDQTERLRLTLGFSTTALPDPSPAPVPVPSALLLLGSGLVGLMGMRKRFA